MYMQIKVLFTIGILIHQMFKIYHIDSQFPQANITRQNNCWKFHEYIGGILKRVSH